MFAARFIAIATVGIVIGGGSALVRLVLLVELLDSGNSAALAISAEIFLRLLVDMLLVGGCIGTIARRDWAIRTMIIAAWFSFVLVGLDFIRFIIATSGFGMRIRGAFLLIVLAEWGARLLYGIIAMKLYRSGYADFYFSRSFMEPAGTSADPHEIIPTRAARRTPTFIVRGIDLKTNQETTIESHAKTPALALRSAIMLGLDRETITITPAEEKPADGAVDTPPVV